MRLDPIYTKSRFYELQLKGLFNCPRYWNNLEEIDLSNPNNTITARNQSRPGIKAIYCKTIQEMKEICNKLPNYLLKELIFLEDPPLARVIQGEFTRLDGGWHLRYTTDNGPLGKVLNNNPKMITGISALSLLRNKLDGASFNDMMLITDIFSDYTNTITPVIEFSVFQSPVGQMLGRNTIIWEVRNY